MFILYGKEGCPHCLKAKAALQLSNTPHLAVPVDNNPVASIGIIEIWKQKEGKGELKIPVIITPDGNVIAGFDEGVLWDAIRDFHIERCNSEFAKIVAGQQASGTNTGQTS